jgi:hypothetical protein
LIVGAALVGVGACLYAEWWLAAVMVLVIAAQVLAIRSRHTAR